jgi:hypothetical protein
MLAVIDMRITISAAIFILTIQIANCQQTLQSKIFKIQSDLQFDTTVVLHNEGYTIYCEYRKVLQHLSDTLDKIQFKSLSKSIVLDTMTFSISDVQKGGTYDYMIIYLIENECATIVDNNTELSIVDIKRKKFKRKNGKKLFCGGYQYIDKKSKNIIIEQVRWIN